MTSRPRPVDIVGALGPPPPLEDAAVYSPPGTVGHSNATAQRDDGPQGMGAGGQALSHSGSASMANTPSGPAHLQRQNLFAQATAPPPPGPSPPSATGAGALAGADDESSKRHTTEYDIVYMNRMAAAAAARAPTGGSSGAARKSSPSVLQGGVRGDDAARTTSRGPVDLAATAVAIAERSAPPKSRSSSVPRAPVTDAPMSMSHAASVVRVHAEESELAQVPRLRPFGPVEVEDHSESAPRAAAVSASTTTAPAPAAVVSARAHRSPAAILEGMPQSGPNTPRGARQPPAAPPTSSTTPNPAVVPPLSTAAARPHAAQNSARSSARNTFRKPGADQDDDENMYRSSNFSLPEGNTARRASAQPGGIVKGSRGGGVRAPSTNALDERSPYGDDDDDDDDDDDGQRGGGISARRSITAAGVGFSKAVSPKRAPPPLPLDRRRTPSASNQQRADSARRPHSARPFGAAAASPTPAPGTNKNHPIHMDTSSAMRLEHDGGAARRQHKGLREDPLRHQPDAMPSPPPPGASPPAGGPSPPAAVEGGAEAAEADAPAAKSTQPHSVHIRIGTMIKRWVVVSRIGAGSFGETFCAVEVPDTFDLGRYQDLVEQVRRENAAAATGQGLTNTNASIGVDDDDEEDESVGSPMRSRKGAASTQLASSSAVVTGNDLTNDEEVSETANRLQERRLALEVLAALPADLAPTRQVCIKLEQACKNVLRLEVVSVRRCQDCPQVPRLFGSGHLDAPLNVNYLVMEKLGPNLAELRRCCPRNVVDVFTTVKTGISCLHAIRQVHEAGFVHRDVKPSNFVVGLGPTRARMCYLIDFGLARKYRRSNGAIRPPRENTGFRGTNRYASIQSHLNCELGRVDDLWPLLFMLVEMATGTLPWRKYRDKEAIGDCKKRTVNVDLVREMPREFTPFVEHLLTLSYDSDPDYEHLLGLLEAVLVRRGYVPDRQLEWEEHAQDLLELDAHEDGRTRKPLPLPPVIFPVSAAVGAAAAASATCRADDAAKDASPAAEGTPSKPAAAPANKASDPATPASPAVAAASSVAAGVSVLPPAVALGADDSAAAAPLRVASPSAVAIDGILTPVRELKSGPLNDGRDGGSQSAGENPLSVNHSMEGRDDRDRDVAVPTSVFAPVLSADGGAAIGGNGQPAGATGPGQDNSHPNGSLNAAPSTPGVHPALRPRDNSIHAGTGADGEAAVNNALSINNNSAAADGEDSNNTSLKDTNSASGRGRGRRDRADDRVAFGCCADGCTVS